MCSPALEGATGRVVRCPSGMFQYCRRTGLEKFVRDAMRRKSVERNGKGVGGIKNMAMVRQLCLLQGKAGEEWNCFLLPLAKS